MSTSLNLKKNSTTYATILVDDIRATHQSDSTATWSDLPDKIRREAEVIFEDVVGDEFPLKACVERWGARLVMRKAFLKREKVAGMVIKRCSHIYYFFYSDYNSRSTKF